MAILVKLYIGCKKEFSALMHAVIVLNPTHTMRECIPGCEVNTQAYAEFNTSYITLINNISWYLSGVTGVAHVEAMQFFFW